MYLYPQDFQRLDSLLAKLETTTEDTLKVDLYNSIASEYRNSNMEMVSMYADSALVLAQQHNYLNGQVRAYFNIGNMHYISGNFAETLDNYLKALEILEKNEDKKGVANALMGVGNVYAILKEHEKAIEYQEKSLKIRKELDDSIAVSQSYNNLGSIYMSMGKYKEALDYHFKSLEIKEQYGLWKQLSSSFGNIGTAYKELGELDKALEYQEKALEIRKKLNNRKGMVMSYTDIGAIYLEKGLFHQALSNQKKAVEIAQDVPYKEGEVLALLSLSKTSEKMGNLREALDYYKEYSVQNDSLFTIQKSKEIADLESVYVAEQQKQQIALLEKDQVIKELEIKRQKEQLAIERSRQVAVISVLVLVICIAVFLVHTVIRKKKANRLISEQKKIVEEKNKEITESITYAKRIQDAILPPEEKLDALLVDYFVYFIPKDIVAGDFYWLDSVEENELFVAAADCTGHGVSGAMVSIVCHNALNRVVREFKFKDPGEILDKTRELVINTFVESGKDVRDGMDVALCRIDKSTQQLYFSGANNPVYIIRNEELIELEGNRQPVGRHETKEPFTTQVFQLEKEDVIYLFSDGFADQFGGKKEKKFMYGRFKKLLISMASKPMDTQKKLLDDAFHNWKGDFEQIDDVCVIGVRI